MSPVAESVLERLDATRQKWWLFTLLSTLVLAVSFSFGLLLTFVAADALIRCSQLGLILLFAAWLATTAGLLGFVGYRLARSHRSLEATARRIEWECPELGNDLINVVQLADDVRIADRAFCEAAIRNAAARIGTFRFDEAARREGRLRRFVHCMQMPRDLAESTGLLALLAVLAVVSSMLLPNWGSAASRLMKPWGFVPSVGQVGEIRVSPGNTEVLAGTSVEVLGTIENPAAASYPATLFVAAEGDAESSYAMAPDEAGANYRATIPAVVSRSAYRLEIGDSQSGQFTIQVSQKPAVERVGVRFHFPAYIGRSDDSFEQKDADLQAPQFTEAELRIHASTPIAMGHLMLEGQQLPGRVEEQGRVLVAKLPLLKETTFTIHLENAAGKTDQNPRVNRVRVVPDRPPAVELLKPGVKDTAMPGSTVPVMIRVTDDYGVGRVRLEMKIKDAAAEKPEGKAEDAEDKAEEGEAKPEPDNEPGTLVQEWTKFDSSTTVALNHRLELAADRVKPGQRVLVRAVACDKREYHDWGQDLKPQETRGPWHTVRIVSPDAKATAAVQQIENLRDEVLKILEKQVKARVRATTILPAKDLARRTAAAGDVRTMQVEIQKRSAEVVQSVKEADKQDRQAIKRILNQLASGEMLQAVRVCDELAKQTSLEGFDEPCPKLIASQERIIEILRKLLDIAMEARSEAMEEMGKRSGGDLPDDTKKKLEDAKSKLDEFLKQQKKLIEATENLAKKPTEDFSEEDEQLLKKIAAAEDDWSKFMQDLHSDLSKLPEQDFANASIAKELVEIFTEIKMQAEDSLTKKSCEIAVPLEQLGYERAEELKSNLEKWLTDTPDREKWSQEESPSDADKEAPMAELPGELEDIIGDLMEEEEDIFDEMEDVSSSAADSLDKGAGWDAADGPISNMSAKGVTGNRLPNTSEIGGRAGEGRQGKSSGEFVGDEAVGKGGRKTPSRLTPDPVMKGQIKDHSKEATGGATGGGKESGEGGEGLEGPAPNSPGQRERNRLAGKQADLRNRAEGVDLKFQVGSFHHTDLKRMIESMKQVEDELKAGNYQNALRQRQVLAERMNNLKQYLEGEVEIRKDNSTNVPGEIQKDILGGMQDPSPAGWEELNREYFGRLSSGGAPAAAPAPATPKEK
jgi:hypothetical protein